MRKFIIILTTLAITGLAYWGYLQISGSATLDPPAAQSDHTLTLPETTDTTRRVGQTLIHEVEQSYYITRDPVTRQVTRVFGFSRLNNPGSQSARWEVEKPYVVLYESSFQCRIDADSGQIQTEGTGTTVTPRDGQLEGNVIIRIQPQPGSRIAETTIRMDDVLFSSERTEFSTDGPVQVVSSQVELSGRGLVLLINATDGHVEYFHILDVESLRLKDFVQTQTQQTAKTSSSPAGLKPRTHTEPQRSYQCILEDNVNIQYGNQIVVAGADHVDIQNIFFSGPHEDSVSSKPEVKADTAPAATETLQRQITTDTPTPSVPAASARRDDSRDIVITCDGGILVKPMPTTAAATAPAIAMNGTPLRIEQMDSLSPQKTSPLAHCGNLRYDMATEVLKLNTNAQIADILLDGGNAGRIKTQGPVIWDRRANQAQIVGPGMVYLEGDTSTGAGQIDFAGQMELFFADAPATPSGMPLAAANLTGGMAAQLRSDGTMMTAAETAHLTFGPHNTLSSVRLEGAVQFHNSNGSSSAATARTAVFHFDDNSRLARATLNGDVRLAAEGSSLQTDEAIISFAADKDGAIQPTQFTTVSPATLETHDAASPQPAARFEARSITYDLMSGSGRAAGPVRFIFHQPADPDRGLLTEYWPVEITADGDAEFISGDEGKIDTVVLKKNVHGVQTLHYAGYTENNAFHAETMTIRLGQNTAGDMDIQQITLHDGDVYAESKRTHETMRLAMTRLRCQKILYDRQNERLVATGPGEIAIDNSKADTAAASGGLDLRGPSYAKIEGFDRIEWASASRRLIADGGANLLTLNYIPLINGVPSRQLIAAAGRVEMHFADDAQANTQLSQLVAKDRVYVEEHDAQHSLKHIFEGYKMIYDVKNDGWMSFMGTEERPCMVDGARVPYIHYNINTEQLETKLSTIPGAVTIP